MSSYLIGITKQFEYYKLLGDKTFEQLNEHDIHWQFNNDSNSITIIVKHIVGNMLSRWTNFLNEDGEKLWRHRESEFEDTYISKSDMIADWKKGWQCLFDAIKPLNDDELERIIYIRNQGHTVSEAINRQLSHYAYHIGQLVFVGKMIKGEDWQSLSIPKGQSLLYNQEKFGKEKGKRHFTDDL
jgi:hypothetical protein